MGNARTALAGLALSVAAAAPAQAQTPAIAGDWRTDDGKAIVAIEPCGSGLCGRIDRFLVPEPAGGARDTDNPNRELRDRKLLGIRVLWELSRDGDVWKGRGYSPQDGRYFDAKVRKRGGKLEVRGCVLFICKTKVWTRA